MGCRDARGHAMTEKDWSNIETQLLGAYHLLKASMAGNWRQPRSGFELYGASLAKSQTPRMMPGLLMFYSDVRSILRDDGATPVEAVNQRRAYGLHYRLHGNRKTGQANSGWRYERFWQGSPLVLGNAIFGLHEPTGSGDAEDIQGVFHAAANEPAITMECWSCRESPSSPVVQQRRTRKLRKAVSAIDVGQNIRSDEITEPHARSCVGPILQRAGNTKGARQWICNRTSYAPELPISENTSDPGSTELPIVTDARRAEKPIATVFMPDRQRRAAGKGRGVGACVEYPKAAAAEDIEAGPVIDWRRRGRSLVGTGGKIGRDRRSGKGRERGQREHYFLHVQFLGV